MGVRKKPSKSLRPKPAPRKVRIHTTPQLTSAEYAKLQARAAAEMRSVANYVAHLVVPHLSGKGNGRRKAAPLALSEGERRPYEIAIPLTPEQKAQLEAIAEEQLRSVSGLVGRWLLADLGQG